MPYIILKILGFTSIILMIGAMIFLFYATIIAKRFSKKRLNSIMNMFLISLHVIVLLIVVYGLILTFLR